MAYKQSSEDIIGFRADEKLRERVRELTDHLDLSKSEVIKQAIDAFYRQTFNTQEVAQRPAACKRCGGVGFGCDCPLEVLEGREAKRQERPIGRDWHGLGRLRGD